MDWFRWQELVGFLAFGLNLAGNEMLTLKNRRGWHVRIWSNAAQFAYALLVWSPYLLVNAVTFGIQNLHGFARWKRMDGHADTCGVAKRRSCNCGRLA